MPDAYNASYFAKRYRYAPTSIYWWSVRYYAGLLTRALRRERRAVRPRVLELGCGTGHVLMHLAHGCAVWGADISRDAIQQARTVAPMAQLFQARAEALPFAAASFDGAVARHVLEHVGEPERATRELRRVLRPGGVLLAAMPNPTSFGRSLKGDRWYGFQDETHVSLLAPPEWARLFQASGFRIERQWGDGLWDVPYLRGVPAPLQLLLFGLPAAAQVASGGGWIPTRAGESVIFLLCAA